MALKRITPDLSSNRTLITNKEQDWVDIDLAFVPKPGTPVDGVNKGDLYKKKDAAAVIQSVRNLLLTNHNEKPFLPTYGGNIRSMLFESKENYSENFIRSKIRRTIEQYEKRALIQDITFFDDDGFRIRRGVATVMDWVRNDITIKVEFLLETNGEVYTASVNMSRLR